MTTVKRLREILNSYDDESPIYIELEVNPGPFIALPLAKEESGISVYGEGGTLYLKAVGLLDLAESQAIAGRKP